MSKKLKYYKGYPVEDQKKFLDLVLEGKSWSEALEESQIEEDYLRDLCNEGKVTDTDLEHRAETIEADLVIEDTYDVYVSSSYADCYDYDLLNDELEISVVKYEPKSKKENKEPIKAKTFDYLEELIDSTGPTAETATTLFEQIKARAQGHVYNNAESYEHRMEDIIYICNLYLGEAEDEE